MKQILFIFSILIISLPACAQKIKVIVNANNPIERMTKDQLQDYFFKRARHWPDGTPVRFFDRVDNSQERVIFLSDFIKRTPRQVERHWIGQKLYSGDSSPTQVTSDSMIVSLVSRFPGGIGYVSENFQGVGGVKVIEVIGE